MSAQTVEFDVIKKDEVEKTLSNVEESIDEVVERALNFNVCSHWAAEEAVELIGKVKGLSKKIDQARKNANEPYRKLMNLNNDRVAPFTDKLGRIEYILKGKIDAWKAREAKLREEQEEVEKALDLQVSPYMTTTVNIKSTNALSYEKTEWKYEVQCLALVPINYIQVDDDKVTAMLKAGVREIPGLKIYEEKKTIIRSR